MSEGMGLCKKCGKPNDCFACTWCIGEANGLIMQLKQQLSEAKAALAEKEALLDNVSKMAGSACDERDELQEENQKLKEVVDVARTVKIATEEDMVRMMEALEKLGED